MKKLSNGKDTGNTSSYSHEVRTTVNDLKRVCGTPTFKEPPEKVSIGWEMETEDGEVFTIYDWKEYSKPAARFPNRKVNFHIGARDEKSSLKAQEELLKALQS